MLPCSYPVAATGRLGHLYLPTLYCGHTGRAYRPSYPAPGYPIAYPILPASSSHRALPGARRPATPAVSYPIAYNEQATPAPPPSGQLPYNAQQRAAARQALHLPPTYPTTPARPKEVLGRPRPSQPNLPYKTSPARQAKNATRHQPHHNPFPLHPTRFRRSR
jgi:hypothetical protein